MDPRLSVVIPAFNEATRIGTTLDKLLAYFRQQPYTVEVLVVDDGSTDQTAEAVQSYCRTSDEGKVTVRLLSNGQRLGKGGAVRRGVLEARGEFTLFSDADLSTPIEEVEKLLGFLSDGYDVAIGSRGLKESAIAHHQAWYREWMGKLFNRVVQYGWVPRIWDTQCGFEAFRRPVAKALFNRQRITGFAFDVEILTFAVQDRYRIREVPVAWSHAPESKVRLWRDGLRMLKDLLVIRRMTRNGRNQVDEYVQT